MLTPEQTSIIKATVPVLQQHGDKVTSLFYKRLLEENEDLKNTFNTANQVNDHQSRALAGAVLGYAANIDNLAVLESAIERITQKHASLVIEPAQYAVVGKYLLAAFGEVLGSAFTDEIRDAWAAAYSQLAQLMIDTEAKLYAQQEDWTGWRDFVIAQKTPESRQITSFTLQPVDKKPLPPYRPGQYISISVDVPSLGHRQPRQYSLSDKPSPTHYRISVKREPGAEPHHPGIVSNLLHDKQVGEVVQLSLPRGDFFLDIDNTSPVVLISAGVGVTPMMAMLNTLLDRHSPRPISWVHGAHTAADQAFGTHVERKASAHPHLQTKVFITKPDVRQQQQQQQRGSTTYLDGRIDLDQCTEEELHLEDHTTEYYICGPTAFMLDVRKTLRELGVDEERVKLELFGTGGVERGRL